MGGGSSEMHVPVWQVVSRARSIRGNGLLCNRMLRVVIPIAINIFLCCLVVAVCFC
jgi:hypothetical protein